MEKQIRQITIVLLFTALQAGLSQSDVWAGSLAPVYEVHAFYYPWYGNPQTDGSYLHWSHRQFVKEGVSKSYPGGDDIGADFYPKLGCYSSNSDTDLSEHMQMLRRARIGVISTSWWGKDTYTDKAVPRLLDAAANHGIKVCFHIEPFPGRNAQTTREAIAYIIDKYGSHSAFYRYGQDNPRPLFYVYDSYITPAEQWQTILSPESPQTIRNTKYDSIIIGLWVKEHEQDFMTKGHFDGYYTYFATDGFTYGSTIKNWPGLAEWAKKNDKLYIPSVGPGYIDLRIRPWNDVNTRDRQDGQYYDREFAAAIDVDPKIISITSFNEWHEGTQIEPAVPRQISDFKYLDYTPHNPEYYLDRTNYWISRFTTPETSRVTQYMIIITGGELLSGAYPDGHTYFLTQTLHPLGLHCIGSMCVDDKPDDVKAALRYAADKAPLVIVTGGLGPTANDITREALSDFTGIALIEHPDVLQAMTQRFRTSPSELRANLRKQTQVPAIGTYLKNTNGTAVGLVFESGNSVIVALPGPPRELQVMVRDELVPYLSRRFGTRSPGRSLRLRFVGLGQSQIDQTLKEHVPLAPDVIISSQFEGSRVDFTFSLPEDTPQERARLDELKQQIMKYLGEYIYADDETTLEEHVVGLLKVRSLTLALAEAGSGGSLAAAISSADGGSEVLAGAYTAPTMEKLRNILRIGDDIWAGSITDSQKAERLAIAASDATASRCAVAVGQRRLNQRGESYVDVAFKLPGSLLESRQFRLSGSGELARSRFSTQLLDEMRRKLR